MRGLCALLFGAVLRLAGDFFIPQVFITLSRSEWDAEGTLAYVEALQQSGHLRRAPQLGQKPRFLD